MKFLFPISILSFLVAPLHVVGQRCCMADCPFPDPNVLLDFCDGTIETNGPRITCFDGACFYGETCLALAAGVDVDADCVLFEGRRALGEDNTNIRKGGLKGQRKNTARRLQEEHCSCDDSCTLPSTCQSMEDFCDSLSSTVPCDDPGLDIDSIFTRPGLVAGNCCPAEPDPKTGTIEHNPKDGSCAGRYRHGSAYCPTDGDSDTTSGAGGDPHFKTWAGDWYDYHGLCDLVLVHSEEIRHGHGLDIHLRTKERSGYSYIESAAIKIGSDILEVGSFGEYWVNGVEGADMPAAMAGHFPITYEEINKKRHKFTISLGRKEAIVVSTMKDMVSVTIENASKDNFRDSVGLMGTFSDGSLVARDGTTVIQDLNAFGQEWQVKNDEPKLFQAIRAPQHPQQACIVPDPTKHTSRRLEEGISQEAAELACSQYEEEDMKDMCIFDVLAMGDLEVADAHGVF